MPRRQQREAVFLPFDDVDRPLGVDAPQRPAQAQAVDQEAGAAHPGVWEAHDAHAFIDLLHLASDGIGADHRDVVSACHERAPERSREGADAAVRRRRIFAAQKADMHDATPARP